MAEKLDNIIGNLKQGSAWVRVILMIAFAVVLYVIIPAIVLVLMLTQTLFVFITGDSNDTLRVLGTVLSKYIFEVLQFLSYASDNRPFPFSAFPSVENDDFSFNAEEKSNNRKFNYIVEFDNQFLDTHNMAIMNKTMFDKTYILHYTHDIRK